MKKIISKRKSFSVHHPVLLLCLSICFNISVQAQSLNIQKNNATIADIFEEIEKQTGLTIAFNTSTIDVTQKRSIQVKNQSLEKVLSEVLKGTKTTFRIQDKRIIILSVSQTDVVSHSTHQIAEGKEISGKITDNAGEPLIGVSIMDTNSSNGTVTDTDGKFTIKVPPKTILVVSYVGYKTKRVNTGSTNTINIVLEEDDKLLDEVIVIGYGIMKRSDINASIVSVKPEDLVKSSSPDFSEMLMGRAAGLTVSQTSAQPGGGIEVLIRGAASTGAGNQPLYVIDGFPIVNAGVSPGSGTQWSAGSRGPLSDINPNDIASIEILKDASATAIYGARGANGVILITTKRGTNQSRVEYNMSTSIQQIIKKPELLSGNEFMREQERYNKELYLMTNTIFPYGNTDPSNVSPYYPKYTEEEIRAAGAGTNWYDLIIRTGKVNQHNLTITYGNDDIKSLVSFNVFDQEGVIKTSGYSRYSLRYNLDHKIIKWWDYGISVLGSYATEKNAALGNGRDAAAGIIESALNYSPLVKAERNPSSGAWVEDPNQALLNHPLSYLDMQDKTKTKRFLSAAYTNFHIIQDVLWIKLSGGTDIRDGLRQAYYPMTTRYGSQIGGDANINSAYREDYSADAVVNFQQTLNDRHKFIAMGGYSYQIMNYEDAYARAMGFTSDAISWYRLQAGEKRPVVSSSKSKHILASYFGRVQYSLSDKYLFTFTGRIDGSDRFGENNRYAFFPSGAFAWRAINEDFLNNIDWLSDAKLRVSVGQVGNENIGNGAASEYYQFEGRNYYFGDSEKRGINLGKFGNPNLKWETTSEANLGVDLGFFRNRINGNIDIFYKEIKDLLSYRALPHTSIIGNIPWNIGKTRSSGVEITLNTVNLEGPLYWESTLTYTSYRDRWKERDPKVILRPYEKEDAPLSALYALIPDGIKTPDEETPHMPGLLPGQQKYKDVNGLDEDGNLTGKPDGKIDQADVVYIGTHAPKFTMGFNNEFKYKGFDLNLFLYASVGAYRWPSTHVEHGVYGSYGTQMLRDNYNYLKEIQNRWGSDNLNATMPSGEVNSYDAFGASHFEKASYLRLKNLTLGYDITRFFNVNRLNARVFFTGQNLFTITEYKGFDPEVERDRASYPQQKTFSFGLDIKF